MKYLLSALCSLFLSSSCTAQTAEQGSSVKATGIASGGRMKVEDITAQTAIDRVIADIDFSPWGRLIFPADSSYWSGTTLGSLQLRWYSHIDAAKTVEIIRYFKAQSLRGEPVFFDIYTELEKQRDPRKRNTGLFFFRGKKGAKSAICSAGGGKGDIQPLIIVAATFDNGNEPQDFARSVEELSVFHNDFRDALLPFIDSHFNTNASRNSRAFSGFSLGAVTTWYEFCYNNDLIKYFLPLSGDCWIMGTYGGRYQPQATTDRLEQLVQEKGYTAADYEIYAAVGTRDPIWDQVNNQLTEMLTRSTFSGGNIRYAVKQGGRHDYDAIAEYLYNALPLYFGN